MSAPEPSWDAVDQAIFRLQTARWHLELELHCGARALRKRGLPERRATYFLDQLEILAAILRLTVRDLADLPPHGGLQQLMEDLNNLGHFFQEMAPAMPDQRDFLWEMLEGLRWMRALEHRTFQLKSLEPGTASVH